MIRITSIGSPWLRIDQVSRSYIPGSGSGAETVRYNTGSQQFEVADGKGGWHTFYQDIDITLSDLANDLLQWASKKRSQEQELDRLCKEYPNLAEARHEFEILHRLVQDHEKSK